MFESNKKTESTKADYPLYHCLSRLDNDLKKKRSSIKERKR